MVVQIVEQLLDLRPLAALALQVEALEVGDRGQQVQTVVSRQARERQPLDPRQTGVVRPTGDEQAPLGFAVRQLAVEGAQVHGFVRVEG